MGVHAMLWAIGYWEGVEERGEGVRRRGKREERWAMGQWSDEC